MNLAELRTEVKARGFDYLPDARINRFINTAYTLDICEDEDWPFLEATVTGTAPLTISDLRSVDWVLDTTNRTKLRPLSQKHITDVSTDENQIGTPENFYVDEGDTIKTFPTNPSVTIQVRYTKAATELTQEEDEPVFPDRFHYLVVEGAIRRAYEDDDEWQAAATTEQIFKTRLQAMKDSYATQQRDRPAEFIVVSDPYAFQ